MAKLMGVREQRHQPLYDVLVRDDGTTNTSRRTNLFGNTNVGTVQNSNMKVPGALGSDNTYVVLALRCFFSFETNTMYDQTARQLYFSFDVADKPQIQAPCWYAPGGGGIHGYDGEGGAGSAHLNNGVPSHEAILKIAKPVLLPARQTFTVVMEFYTLTTEDARSSLNANTSSKLVMFMLDGIETRDVL